MATALVRATVEKILVVYNGDPNDAAMRDKLEALEKKIAETEKKVAALQAEVDGGNTAKKGALTQAKRRLARQKKKRQAKEPDKDNALVATLRYPRSGSSSVLATRAFDLESKKEKVLEGGFLDTGLLKEVIQGETGLTVHITDRDKRNRVWVFIRKVLGAIFGSLIGADIGKISEVVVASTATEVAGSLQSAVVGSDQDRIETVAQSKEVRIKIGRGGIEVENPSDDIRFEGGLLTLKLTAPNDLSIGDDEEIAKGDPNGHVVLRLTQEAP